MLAVDGLSQDLPAPAAAIELPQGLRINVVSPTILKESEARFGPFFPGMIPVEGWKVGRNAFIAPTPEFLATLP
jgi:hypothetical protein